MDTVSNLHTIFRNLFSLFFFLPPQNNVLWLQAPLLNLHVHIPWISEIKHNSILLYTEWFLYQHNPCSLGNFIILLLRLMHNLLFCKNCIYFDCKCLMYCAKTTHMSAMSLYSINFVWNPNVINLLKVQFIKKLQLTPYLLLVYLAYLAGCSVAHLQVRLCCKLRIGL